MAWDQATLNAAAEAVTAQGLTAALFNGDPTASGTEVSGGTPAYARKELTFTLSSDKYTATAEFDIPSGAQFDHVALFESTTLKNAAQVTAESYGSQGTYSLTVNIQAQNTSG